MSEAPSALRGPAIPGLQVPKDCTGHVFDETTIHHDAGSCPIHEPDAFAAELAAIPLDRCRIDGAIVTFEVAHRLLDECAARGGFIDTECSHPRCPRACPNWIDPQDSQV